MHWSYKTWPELAHLEEPAKKDAFRAAAQRVPKSWFLTTLLLLVLPIFLAVVLGGPALGLNRTVAAGLGGAIVGGLFGFLQLRRVRRVIQEEQAGGNDPS